MSRYRLYSLITLVATAILAPLHAADWPQWRGPDRNGISVETGWLDRWPAEGAPPVLWRANVGKGHSCPVITDGRLFIMGWDGQRDTVYCLDAASGNPIWKQSYSCDTIVQWPGPRSTPTVEGDTVYTLGQWGQLNAWDVASGERRWGMQLPANYNPDIDYGFAWSPLIEDDLLILAAGSQGLAIRKKDGTFAWGNDGQHGACASPVPYVFQGQRGVAVITTDPGRDSVRLVGVDPRSGEELWRSPPWPEKWGAACVDLLIADGKVFVTTAEQHLQCARFAIDGNSLTEEWSNRNLSSYTGTGVLLDGHLYAVEKRGLLKCLNWETGNLVWDERGFGEFGSLTAADGKLLIQTSDRGVVEVVAATPEGYRRLRQARVFEGEAHTFTAPVLANGRLYCRSYAGELVCFDLR